MTQEDLKQRTKAFALRIIRLVDTIPATKAGHTIGNQVIRSGTSVGANYRSACKSKSDRDFLNKMVIIEEEADETQFWLELLQESGLIKTELIDPILKEAKELTAIFTASGRTVRERLNKKGSINNSTSRVSEPDSFYNSRFEIRNSEFLESE